LHGLFIPRVKILLFFPNHHTLPSKKTFIAKWKRWLIWYDYVQNTLFLESSVISDSFMLHHPHGLLSHFQLQKPLDYVLETVLLDFSY